jgi:hypothetical protein
MNERDFGVLDKGRDLVVREAGIVCNVLRVEVL